MITLKVYDRYLGADFEGGWLATPVWNEPGTAGGLSGLMGWLYSADLAGKTYFRIVIEVPVDHVMLKPGWFVFQGSSKAAFQWMQGWEAALKLCAGWPE